MSFPSILKEKRGDFLLSDDSALIDVSKVHRWISEESYWANGRSQELMSHAIEGSHMIGVYREGEQVAVSRIVDASVRGHGIGTWMSQSAVAWATSQGINRIVLATRDAHEVYARAGFAPLEGAQRWMEIDTRPQRAAILATMEGAEDEF
jgi:GNAT superfamily N-acetyltransferase